MLLVSAFIWVRCAGLDSTDLCKVLRKGLGAQALMSSCVVLSADHWDREAQMDILIVRHGGHPIWYWVFEISHQRAALQSHAVEQLVEKKASGR
ncbi:expressed unknown protein [Seminavis robusta]|uniref:Uncharacterized protein n=1 Tax=Seminavis robusta TaxID=568900 RepID=A0A9N8ERL7_9STRA|nr:expressed unknown protein [Seminavis robusta]|eukprot:Sro1413_g270602.1  (94) ;mRNA; r:22776-23057